MPIANGSAYTGHPAVGLVFPGQHAGFCSGTLIGPRTVLTAAHCLHPMHDADPPKGLLRPLPCLTPPEEWPPHSVCDGERDILVFTHASFLVDCPELANCEPNPGVNLFESTGPPALHPAYAIGTAIGDLGLIHLAAAPPAAPIAVRREKPAAGSGIHVVGYGRTAPEEQDSGIKRHAFFTVHDPGGLSLSFAARGDGHPAAATCSGDSGGPALIGEEETAVAGVVVGGSRRRCDYQNRYAATDAAWIATTSAGDALLAESDRDSPEVALLAPADGASFEPGAAGRALVELSAAVRDRSLTFAVVEIDGAPAGELALADAWARPPTYSTTLSLGSGQHQLSVVATDQAGNSARAAVAVHVSRPGEPDDDAGVVARPDVADAATPSLDASRSTNAIPVPDASATVGLDGATDVGDRPATKATADATPEADGGLAATTPPASAGCRICPGAPTSPVLLLCCLLGTVQPFRTLLASRRPPRRLAST